MKKYSEGCLRMLQKITQLGLGNWLRKKQHIYGIQNATLLTPSRVEDIPWCRIWVCYSCKWLLCDMASI